MRASVIVCTYNRSPLLQRLLEALAGQTAPPETFEIIVVDDGSTDDTAVVCRAMTERLPQMRYLTMDGNCGLSAAGNRAAAQARGQYLLFTDDDCIPAPNWVEKMGAALQNAAIVAGTVVSPPSGYFKLCHNIAQFYPFMPGQSSRKPGFIAGANMGLQAGVMQEAGEFNRETSIPDMEFILRARSRGFTITYAPDAVVCHDPPRTTLCAALSYAAAHASETILLRRSYRELLHTPFILYSPALLLLLAPIIAFKTAAGIYLGNRELLRSGHTFPTVYLIKLAWCWGAARGLRKKRKTKR
jgi:GT2 family glycosyltransferase